MKSLKGTKRSESQSGRMNRCESVDLKEKQKRSNSNSSTVRSAMFKTRGGQRPFEQCSKKNHKLDDEGLPLTSLLQIILLTSNVCFGLPKNCVSDGHFPALVTDEWVFFSRVGNS